MNEEKTNLPDAELKQQSNGELSSQDVVATDVSNPDRISVEDLITASSQTPVETPTIKEKFKTLKLSINKQTVKTYSAKLARRWFIDAFSGMALGLFATLIAGTIISQIGTLAKSTFIIGVGTVVKMLMGAGIGAGIAYMLKADKLTTISCMAAGMLGANGNGLNIVSVGVGNPIGAYIAALFACEICKLYAGKTKLDIILIPLGAVAAALFIVVLICPPVNALVALIADGIAISMEWNPIIMGIVIATVMGILLTLPTSSAAIWVSIAATSTSPYLLLAGGAAVVGCASHMVGFAVASFKENKVGGLIAQGLGTSMLQIPNLMKNPKIMIPAIVSSIITGPLATTVFKLKCNASGGGMGTAGLVGVFGTIEASTDIPLAMLIIGIILLFFVIPAVVSFFVSEILRKFNWIKVDDMKLTL
ncbi:MAG: PTS sugar transporter subunit IIC [Christensenellaceae bacterium]|jgi:uncharacterized membrane protein|nr:PTS sugar transporter subunit IIC [Christensenellaceae bacterium]